MIEHNWDLIFPNGAEFTGAEVRADFRVPPGNPQPDAKRTWRKEGYWSDGKFVVARSAEPPAEDPQHRSMVARGVVDVLGSTWWTSTPYDLEPQNGSGDIDGETVHIPTSGWNSMWPDLNDTRVFRLAKSNRVELLDTLVEPASRNFFFLGNALPDSFGVSIFDFKDRWPDQANYYTRITLSEVRQRLQNDHRRHEHPYRLVFFKSCHAADGDLCRAFGIPREQTTAAKYAKRGVPTRAFIGAKGVASGPSGTPFQPTSVYEKQFKVCMHSLAVFFRHWLYNDTAGEALGYAKSAYSAADPLDSGEPVDPANPNGPKERERLPENYTLFGAADAKRNQN